MLFSINAPLDPINFIGRKEAISVVSGRLAGRLRQSTCLAGGPLTGKTSLLRYLAQADASANLLGLQGACRVFFDGFSVGLTMLPSGFWAGILRGLQGQPQTAPLQALLAEKLAKARDNRTDLYDLEDVFDELANAKMPAVVFVNNFGVLLRNPHFWPPNDFFHIVRSLAQREPRGLSFVISTYRQLDDLWDPDKGASPFYNIFETVALGLMEEEEIRRYVKAGFDGLGLPLASDVEATIMDASEGHPFLVNYLAYLCAESLKAGHAVDGQMLDHAFQNPAGPVISLIHQIRDCLTPAEKSLLETLGANPGKLSANQKSYLCKLRAYGLLPPGLKSKL